MPLGKQYSIADYSSNYISIIALDKSIRIGLVVAGKPI
jgi:hypothetical protein